MNNIRVPIDKVLKNTVNRLQRRIAIAMLTVRVVAALGSALDAAIRVLLRIPQWVYTLAVGLMWLSMAVVGIGKGQDWAVFCAFLGMLWWALQEKNFADLLHDHIRAIAGWTEAVNALEKAAPQVPAAMGRNEGQSPASGPDLVDTPAVAAP